MSPTTSTVDLSDRDNKETLFVKDEVTNDAEVFGEVVVDAEGSQKEPSSSVLSCWCPQRCENLLESGADCRQQKC